VLSTSFQVTDVGHDCTELVYLRILGQCLSTGGSKVTPKASRSWADCTFSIFWCCLLKVLRILSQFFYSHIGVQTINYTFCLYFNSFIIESTVLVRTLAASHGRFRDLFRHSVGLRWTSDQPVAKAFTYTGQHNSERRGHPCLKRDSNSRYQRPNDQGLYLRQRGHWYRHTIKMNKIILGRQFAVPGMFRGEGVRGVRKVEKQF
jgi:hypothetical protein